MLIGHRGAAGLAPENSLAAFDAAVSAGADAVECDIRASLDGEIMVFHDECLDRLTDRKGRLRDWSAGDLRALCRIRGGHPIPTLGELCVFMATTRAGLFVEIKEPGLADRAMNLLDAHAPKVPCILGSFDVGEVETIVRAGRFPALQLARTGEDFFKPPWLAPAFHAAGIPVTECNRRTVGLLKAKGLAVWVWTANSKRAVSDAVRSGVDGIISDHPDRAAGWMQRCACQNALPTSI